MKKYPIYYENISDNGNFVVKQNGINLLSGSLVDENSEIEIDINPNIGFEYKFVIDNNESSNTKIIVTEPIYIYSNDGEIIQPKMFVNSLDTVKENTNFDVELDLFPGDFGNELCIIHGHTDNISGTKLSINNENINIENNGEFTIGNVNGTKLSEIGNKIINTIIENYGITNLKFELLKVSDLTIISSVEKTISITKNENKMNPEFVLNFPDNINLNEEFNFSVKTVPNDFQNEMVLVRGIINNYQKVDVKYLNSETNTYDLIPYETDGSFIFGPHETGFPLLELTSLFKATIKEAGNYNMKLELYKVSDNEILAEIQKQFNVNSDEGEDEKTDEEFIEEFKKLSEHDTNYSWIVTSRYFENGITIDSIKKFYVEYFQYYQCKDTTDYLIKVLCEKQFGTIEEVEKELEEDENVKENEEVDETENTEETVENENTEETVTE